MTGIVKYVYSHFCWVEFVSASTKQKVLKIALNKSNSKVGDEVVLKPDISDPKRVLLIV